MLSDKNLILEKFKEYIEDKIIQKTLVDKNEIEGHLLKANNNLKFVNDNLSLGYFDWCITGCYYAVYHAALALSVTKGYHSKNHDATLSILIKEYYEKGVNADEIELMNKFYLDYQEILFYVQSKQKREDATYSTQIKFDKKTVNELRLKATLFINKAKEIIKNENN